MSTFLVRLLWKGFDVERIKVGVGLYFNPRDKNFIVNFYNQKKKSQHSTERRTWISLLITGYSWEQIGIYAMCIWSPRDVSFLLINRSKDDLQFICEQASLFQFFHHQGLICTQQKALQKMKYAMFEWAEWCKLIIFHWKLIDGESKMHI